MWEYVLEKIHHFLEQLPLPISSTTTLGEVTYVKGRLIHGALTPKRKQQTRMILRKEFRKRAYV